MGYLNYLVFIIYSCSQDVLSCHDFLSEFLTKFVCKILIDHDLPLVLTAKQHTKSRSISQSSLDTPYFFAMSSSSRGLISTIKDDLTPNTASEVSNGSPLIYKAVTNVSNPSAITMKCICEG